MIINHRATPFIAYRKTKERSYQTKVFVEPSSIKISSYQRRKLPKFSSRGKRIDTKKKLKIWKKKKCGWKKIWYCCNRITKNKWKHPLKSIFKEEKDNIKKKSKNNQLKSKDQEKLLEDQSNRIARKKVTIKVESSNQLKIIYKSFKTTYKQNPNSTLT